MKVNDEIPLVDVEEVAKRLDGGLSNNMYKVVEAAILDLSSLVRHYTGINYNQYNCPSWIKARMFATLAQYARNPEGFTSSRAGDEGVTWAPNTVSRIDFDRHIIAELRAVGAPQGLSSVPTVLYCRSREGVECACSSTLECMGTYPKTGCRRAR